MKATKLELEKIVEKAEVTKLERDDDIKIYHVETSEAVGVNVDVEAKSEKEARSKALDYLLSEDSDEFVVVSNEKKAS